MSRQKGMGRLFLRGGVWYMRWRYRGSEHTESTHIRDDGSEETRRKAEAVLNDATEVLRLRDKATRLGVVKRMLETTEEELRDRLAGIRRDKTLNSLSELFCSSAYRLDISAEQMAAYSRYIDALVITLGGDTRIVDIDASAALAFAKSIAEGRSPNTFNKYIGGLAYIWKAVMPSVGATMNPWESIPRRRLDTSVRRALTEEEIERIFSVATGELRVLFAIGLYTGLRMGDAVRFTWEDIHDNAIYIITSKTGAKVGIPLHPKLAKALGDRGDNSGHVCPTLYSIYKRHGKSAIAQRFGRLFRKCGIATSLKVKDGKARPLCGFHSLRHTFVSRCRDAGIPQPIVQALVGHSSARMTEHYTHLTDSAFLKAFEKL